MKWIFILLVFLAVLDTSCKPESEFDLTERMINNVPDSVLKVDKMIDVLVDIHLAEAMATENKTDSIPQEERLKMYYAQVFAIKKIDPKLFQRSYEYYVQEPVIMDHIFQKVTEKLNLLELEDLNVSKEKNE